MGEDFKMRVTPGWCGWVGIIDTDWNRVSYNLIFLEDASLSNYVLSIVAWDTNHLSIATFNLTNMFSLMLITKLFPLLLNMFYVHEKYVKNCSPSWIPYEKW